jgi:hypothetical protein
MRSVIRRDGKRGAYSAVSIMSGIFGDARDSFLLFPDVASSPKGRTIRRVFRSVRSGDNLLWMRGFLSVGRGISLPDVADGTVPFRSYGKTKIII